MHPLIVDALWYILWLAIGAAFIAVLGWLFEGGGVFFGTLIVGSFVFLSMRDRPVVAFLAFQIVGAVVTCVVATKKSIRAFPKALGHGALISACVFAAMFIVGSVLDFLFGGGGGVGTCTRISPQFC